MRKNLWMLAAILVCGAMTVLTSCSANDNPVDNNSTPTGKTLTGMYAVVLDNENGNIGGKAYSMVLVAYDFKADGTGQWSEMYYNDEDVYPFIGNGGDVGGQFKYTVDAEGKVSFTFDRPDMALQRGTVICLDDDVIALHHAKEDFYYFGALQDEETANEIRTLMRQFNGGNDNIVFYYWPASYGLGVDGDKYTLKSSDLTQDQVDGNLGLTKMSSGCYLQMHGGTVTLDNYTGTYDGAHPLINGMERDLIIILKGVSTINVSGNALGILTSGKIKLGGSGALKITTNAEGTNHFGIQGANYGKDKDALADLAYDNVRIKRMDKVINEDGTCTWTYIVGNYIPLGDVTIKDIGKPVSTDGNVYPCLDDLNAAGATLAGMVASVNGTGHGLILSSKVSDGSTSYEDAIAKVAAYTPAIADCEPWHLPTDVEAAEMVYRCADVDIKPLEYEKCNAIIVKYLRAEFGCNISKLSEKAVKAGVGKVNTMLIDYHGERGTMYDEYIHVVEAKMWHDESPVRACAKF